MINWGIGDMKGLWSQKAELPGKGDCPLRLKAKWVPDALGNLMDGCWGWCHSNRKETRAFSFISICKGRGGASFLVQFN